MLHQLPAFRTLRLTVRPRTIDDLEACMAMDHDTEVTRFLPGPWTDPVAHRAFVEARMRHAHLIGVGYWSVIAAEEFVGWILLTPLDLHGPEIEIGWGTRPSSLGPRLCDGSCAARARSCAQHPRARSGDSRYRSGEHGVGKPRPQTRLSTGRLCSL